MGVMHYSWLGFVMVMLDNLMSLVLLYDGANMMDIAYT